MSRRDSGFTLLEMLVALVVFGLVMAGLSQTFRFGLMAWSVGPAKTAEPETLTAMDAALTRMISQALPGTMTGDPDGLSFTTRLPAGAGLHGGLADTAILPGPGGTLILRYAPHPAGLPLAPPPVPRTEILAQNVTALSIAYLVPHQGGPAAWSSTWQGGSAGLPLLVRIHIDLASGRNWPDLVAAPVGPGN